MFVLHNWTRVSCAAVGGLLMVALLSSCGGDGSVTPPTPTRSPTRTLPTGAPTEAPTTAPTEAPTKTPTEAPTEAPTDTTAPSADEDTVAPTEAPTDMTAPSAEEDTVGPSWLWWLLAGVVALGAALTAVLVPRARRRREWDAHWAAAQDQVSWLRREVIPTLERAVSPGEATGAWGLASSRVSRIEEDLARLGTNAPDDEQGTRARSLRDAVRTARQSVEDLLRSGDSAALRGGLRLVSTELEAALDRSGANR